MDVEYIMTSFSDVLLKECLADTDSLDYDDFRIIDVDDIKATIEDPGYIIEEPLETGSKTEKYKSSYGKRSFSLPATFFDISRNVKLLTKCRPISVKIVDCRIYPWYYKKAKREKKEICFDAKDEETNKETLNTNTDLVKVHSDLSSETLQCLIDQSSAPKFTISSEQSLVISKLKQDIEKINNVQEYDKNTIVNHDSDITISVLNTNKSVAKHNFNKTIEDTDLLKYKVIAETIVRNIDKGDFNLGSDDVQVIKEPEVFHSRSTCSRYNAPVNEDKAINVTTNKNDNPEKKNDQIKTSPILPCTIRSQKRTAKKRNDLKNITTNKHYLDNFYDCNGRLTSSANKVIPHSHYRFTTPTGTAANHVHYMNMNGMMSQYYATQRYLEQNEAIYTHHQPISQVNYLSGNNQSNFVYNQRNINTFDRHCLMESRPNSCYDYNNTIYDLPRDGFESSCVGNLQGTRSSNVGNIKPTKSVNEFPYDYVNSIISHPSQIITATGNKDDVSKKNVSIQNERTISRSLSYSSLLVPNCLCPSQPYVNSTDLQVPKQTTATATVCNNPVLLQLLNKPLEPPINYLSSQHFTKANYATRPNIFQNTINISNNDNKMLSTLELSVDNSNVNVAKSIEKVVNAIKLKKGSESIFPSPNKKIEINAKSNNIPYPPIKTSHSETDTYPEYNTVIDIHGLKSSVSTSRQICQNMSELTKITNSEPQFERSYVEFNNNDPFRTGHPVKTKRDVEPKTLEQVPSKLNGYSPAILPIPTFEKSLQILSELRKHNNTDATNRENNLYQNNSNIHSELKIGRKRQHGNDVNTYRKSKKISLQEYKQRILGTEKVYPKNYVNQEIVPAERWKGDNIKVQQEGHQNVDAQDLGYDSDCTVVIDLQN